VSKRRRSAGGKKAAEAKFWGARQLEAAPGGGEPGPRSIRPTPDPAAVIRSLGPAPLAGDPAMAERHLTAVYEEAVRAATALAAANGLLDTGRGDD
jgi:hypothetical protein